VGYFCVCWFMLIWFYTIYMRHLSVTLFILKINSIIKCLPVCVTGSLYVYDFCIYFCSQNLIAIVCQIQRCINNIWKWANEDGFQFSKCKQSACISFSSIRKMPSWSKIVWCIYTGCHLSVCSSFWVWFLTRNLLSISTLSTWKIDVSKR